MATPQNYRDAVANLQKYLRALSFSDDRIERVPVDGIFDTNTQKALRSFQRTRGLEETGIAYKETFDKLYEEYAELEAAAREGCAAIFFPKNSEYYEASAGEQHSFITLLQLLLQELSVVYEWEDEILVGGEYDDKTERAIRQFQEISRLPITGRVDKRTWRRLVEDFASYTPF